MKTTIREDGSSRKLNRVLASALIAAGLSFCASSGPAQLLPPGYKSLPAALDSWSFHDNTNWTSDLGYAPVSFTNLSFSELGDGASLVVDSTNPAWLQYNVVETNGATNLTVDVGSVTFWFAPNWSSTNQGGNGPGEWGRLLEVGSYTPESSYGWWSIYVDDGGNNIYFSAQTNDLSSSVTTYLSVPISWTTNYFHFVALTYSATNTALYMDGLLATTGPPVSVYPGADVLANGFYIGSDSNGVLQAHGLFNTIATYNYPLDSNTVQQIFNWNHTIYLINPWNIPYMDNLGSAPSSPSTNAVAPDVITGAGYLQWGGAAATCVSSTNAYNVWITNVTATAVGNGTMNMTFTIEGGQDGYAYDVFATGALESPLTNAVWFWMGQGYHCNTYTLPITSPNAFIILGTPQDSDDNGLTDAYELLVSHTNPYLDDQDGAGISDGWQVLLGLNPLVNQVAQPGTRANYTYDSADRLTQVSGIKSGAVTNDAEGNVLSVSQ